MIKETEKEFIIMQTKTNTLVNGKKISNNILKLK